ncbi:MAG: hypothetical protein JXR94_21470 [Candidatus Hydrogenedentes bacterium]|nr:hypothetical protein [Candidatus Hydrogenedentota bacterium]
MDVDVSYPLTASVMMVLVVAAAVCGSRRGLLFLVLMFGFVELAQALGWASLFASFALPPGEMSIREFWSNDLARRTLLHRALPKTLFWLALLCLVFVDTSRDSMGESGQNRET